MQNAPDPNTPASGISKFVSELRQRNVFRVAAAYAISGWLVIQLANNIFPAFDFPRWTNQFVILLVLIGFPIALVLAWAFEITPDGLKRSASVERHESIAPHTGKKLNVLIIASLSALVLFMFIERVFFLETVPVTPSVADIATTENPQPSQTISDKSIAILPFADFSAEGDQGWFADGLSEEILNSLVRIPDLKVASRTSSFSYRDSNLEITEIARAIGVAHILEGSVRRSETRLRITAQLIRAADGFHLWSENYDRAPADAIAIQEDLAISISQALQTVMDPVALAAMANVGTESIAAYNAYLEGLSFWPCVEDLACVTAHERAIGIDPEFAEAQFQLASYWSGQLQVTLVNADPGIPYAEIKERFQRHVGSAIEFANNPVDLLKYRALRARVDLRLADRRELLLAYLESRPNDADAWIALADIQMEMGDRAGSLRALEAAEQLDSRIARAGELANRYYEAGDLANAARVAQQILAAATSDRNALYQAHRSLLWAGEVSKAAEATRLFHQSAFVESDTSVNERARAQLLDIRQACAEGREADAQQIFASFPSIDALGGIQLHWHVLKTLGRNQEAEDLLRVYDSPDAVLELFSFYTYPDFDPRPFPSLMAVLEREGAVLKPLIPIPYACG